MKTFREWASEKHPEAIEEGFLKNAALAAAIGAGAMGVGNRFMSPENPVSSTAQADDFEDEDEDEDRMSSMRKKEAKLRAAADRVGIPKNQQGNLKGHMIGGIVVVVNGKKGPLTPKEAEHVKWTQELARSMGN